MVKTDVQITCDCCVFACVVVWVLTGTCKDSFSAPQRDPLVNGGLKISIVRLP